jgi:hypothetical protein
MLIKRPNLLYVVMSIPTATNHAGAIKYATTKSGCEKIKRVIKVSGILKDLLSYLAGILSEEPPGLGRRVVGLCLEYIGGD